MNNPLILTAAAKAGEGLPLPLILAGYPAEIEGERCHYRRKEVIRAGEWVHRGTREPFKVDRARMDAWVATFNRRLAAGIKPFLPDHHTEQPKAGENFGYVVGLQREGDSLYADVQLIGDQALSLAARNDVSVYVKPEGVDARGGACGEFLHHLALTPDPNQPHLAPFYSIAASAGGVAEIEVPVYEPQTSGAEPERSPKMKPETIQKLRAKLNLTDASAVSDDEVAERAAVLALTDPPADRSAEVVALSADVTRLTAELATAKQEKETATLALSAAQPKQYDELSLSLIGESFKTKREQAIAVGAISEAGANAIDALLMPGGKPSGVALALSGDGVAARPLYARLYEVIAANPGTKTNHGVERANPALALSANGETDYAALAAKAAGEYIAQHYPDAVKK